MASDREHEYRQNVMVGLFMVLALVALGWLIARFGEAPTWLTGGGTYRVHVYFDELRGLRVGTEVEMNSVVVGSVSDIQPRDVDRPTLGIDVILAIQGKYRIPVGSVAHVQQAAIVGRPMVVIDLAGAEVNQFLYTDGTAVLNGDVVSAFDQLIPRAVVAQMQKTARQIGDLAETLTPAAADLHELLVKRTIRDVEGDPTGQTPANLYTAVQRLDAGLAHINDVLGNPDTKRDIREIITNLKDASVDVKEAVASLKQFASKATTVADDVGGMTRKLSGTVDRADEQLDVITRKVIDCADSMSRTLAHLESASRDIALGKGTAGKLVTDDQLYESMVLTARRLEATITDLQSLVRQWKDKGVKLQGGVLGL